MISSVCKRELVTSANADNEISCKTTNSFDVSNVATNTEGPCVSGNDTPEIAANKSDVAKKAKKEKGEDTILVEKKESMVEEKEHKLKWK